jgi:hypothetical protein
MGAEGLRFAAVNAARPTSLPGHELIPRGVRDLQKGVESIEALVVSIGAPRLRHLGVELGQPFAAPEGRLYRLLADAHGDAAHSRYNGLIRRLTSYERALALSAHASAR